MVPHQLLLWRCLICVSLCRAPGVPRWLVCVSVALTANVMSMLYFLRDVCQAELKPEVTETIRSITWKKQKDKIAEWDGSDKPEYYGRCSKDQCDLSPTTGVLVMKGLKREDEWTYSAEINGKTSQEEFLVLVEKRLQYFTFNVMVIAGVETYLGTRSET
uniref:Uncharacterized protein n=1 Tax=Scleropages formosus TaxID=113540 RepID=A0A8C9SPQ1_SCLFO